MSRPHRRVDGKTVSIHRHVWEEANGPIPDGWHVHHIDHDPLNNDLSNLVAMPAEEHRAHHARMAQKHPIERECDVCRKVYEPHPTKRTRSRTCSRECFRRLLSLMQTEGNSNGKIDRKTSATIRKRLADGELGKDLAAEYGVSPSVITYHKKKTQ